VEGLIVETDALGRFHLEGIDVEHLGRGRNFIVKVDPATLPVGAKFTTRNPLIKRITQGLPARFDFGVQVPDNAIDGSTQQVELQIGEVLFAPGSAELGADAGPALDAMAEQIRGRSGGEVVITANGEREALAMDRALVVREALQSRLTAEQMQGLAISVRTDVDAADSLVVGFAQTPVLGVLLFDTDQASIKPQFRPLIEKMAQAMVELQLTRVAITGHADRRASDKHNQALGLRRAKAVYEALLPHLPVALREQVRVDISNDPAAPAGATEK
jgi:outer membrane protein OmpA-like peptidoglycan-associated protein